MTPGRSRAHSSSVQCKAANVAPAPSTYTTPQPGLNAKMAGASSNKATAPPHEGASSEKNEDAITSGTTQDRGRRAPARAGSPHSPK